MATDLVQTEGAENEIALFAGIVGNEINVGVMLASGQGVLKRGSVLIRDSATDTWKLLDAPPEAENRLGILGRTTDTGTEEQISHVYLSGLFNRAAIVLGGSAELDDAAEEILRGKGIWMGCVIPSDGAVPAQE